MTLMNDAETAWTFFCDGFSKLINKHAPIRHYKVKGRNNGWFTPHLEDWLHERDLAWARHSAAVTDWQAFRQ